MGGDSIGIQHRLADSSEQISELRQFSTSFANMGSRGSWKK